MATRFDFDPPNPDPLGVLLTTAPVARAADPVRLDPAAVEAFALAQRDAQLPRHAEEALHCTGLEPERFLNYLLALEALNFCFWDEPPRWTVRYRGASHDGYWALVAALHRAIHEDGVPLWDAAWLAEAAPETLGHLLRGEGRPPPLLEVRAAHLREAGRVLLERWEGQFGRTVESSGGDAVTLALTVAREFPSFGDVARWRGREIRFYKRAQICAADLARLLPDHPLGRLRGLERLTAFADYKVPQVLRREGILCLDPQLAARVDAGEPIPAGSEAEVAIRAATIWGCEWIARALTALRGRPVTAVEVDTLLWSAGQDKTGLPPYHRTRTIYY